MPLAESIVQEGITSKRPALVATILAQREAGVPPSTIGRNFKVHHTTVGRILSAVERRLADGSRVVVAAVGGAMKLFASM